MEQEITVSTSIASYFYTQLNEDANPFEISDLQKCYNLLKQNYFISDKDKIIFIELLHDISLFEDDKRRKEIYNILGKLFIDRTRSINFQLDNSKYKYYRLCNASEDKIYFDPAIQDEFIYKTQSELSILGIKQIEIHNLKSFLEPGRDCRFINPNSRIVFSKTFEKDKVYDLVEILKPYLREASGIKFIDNYLANYLSRYHIEKLLKCLNSNCKISFATLTKEQYLENKKYDLKKAKENFSELEKLIQKYNVIIENIEKTGHLERYIVTDQYEISLPGGFDQFSKDGKPFINDENKILKMFIEKR